MKPEDIFREFEPGSDLTLLDARYQYPKKDINGKWDKGSITLIARDNISKKKYVETIHNPTYGYFVVKDDIIRDRHIDYPLKLIEKECVDRVVVPYVDLEKDIATKIGELNYYYDNIKNGTRRANKLLHFTNPKIMMSDINIEDYYRFIFSLKFKNTIYKPTKAFLDIEADTMEIKGEFPKPGQCPVNAVTLLNTENMTSYTFILNTAGYQDQIDKFKEGLANGTINKEIHELLLKHIGVKAPIEAWQYKEVHRYALDKLKFKFAFYDEEIVLIADLFKLINHLKPDFVLAWNMAFDIPYLIERIKVLGYKPEDIMCDPDFENKKAEYIIDTRTEVLAERGDFANISSYSVYLDQLIQHASVRKGQPAYPEYKLNYVTNLICGFGKLDYQHITPYLFELPYLDFKTFILYNMMDTIDQYCIEYKVLDIDLIFAKAISNNTRYSKIHRQTVYLINRMRSEYYSYGYITGNNVNSMNHKAAEKLAGAFVASPANILDDPKIKINGIPIMVFNNLVDFDYKRLYPSCEQEQNLTDETMIGKLIIEAKLHNQENLSRSRNFFSREGMFFDDLATRNFIEYGQRWFNLASYEDLLGDIQEFFETKLLPMNPVEYYTNDGLKIIYRRDDKLQANQLRSIYSRDDKEVKQVYVGENKVNNLRGVLDDQFNNAIGYEIIRDSSTR